MKKNRYANFFLFILLISTTISMFSCGRGTKQPTDVELLSAIENAFVNVAAKSTPAIVGVSTVHLNAAGQYQQLEGSGFIVRKEGYILTNEHVIRDAAKLKIRLLNGSQLDAQLVGTDLNTEIAVLKIDADEELPVLPLADSEKVRVGQFAIAIGNPFRLDYTVTRGIVSGKGRTILHDTTSIIRYEDFIQTDAWINTGNSGGPLLNIRGEVIGINALIRRPDNAPNDPRVPRVVRAGAGFAIPSNLVKKVSNQLIANGRVIRGFLGIEMMEVPQGIRVHKVTRDSPAHRGGLQRGDIIVKYNGQTVQDPNAFKMWIADSQVGKESKITFLRNRQERTLNVIIAEMPIKFTGKTFENDSVAWKTLGLAVRKLEKRDFERYTYLTDTDQGVIVERVEVNKAKIPRGTLIIAINGQKIRDAREFDAFLQAKRDTQQLILEIKSNYGTEKVTLQLKNSE